MAKANLLSAAFCRNIQDPNLHADGNGLFLVVKKNQSNSTSKSWLLRLRFEGKRPEIGLGSFTEISLAQARERAADIRKLAKQGIDPRDWRKHVGVEETSRSTAPTFDECVPYVLQKVGAELSNAKHRAQWASTLETYASPVVGKLPVDQITIRHIEDILRPIWLTKTETATRVRGRVEKVLAWAIVKHYREPPNPAMWRGNLDMLLPQPSKIKAEKHHAALPYADLPQFMVMLGKKKSLTSKALALTILTTARTQEIIGARWDEFDLKKAVWTVPPVRMKIKKEHRVPLTQPVIDLLRSIPKIEGSPYVFPGLQSGKHISNMAMLKFLKEDLGYPELTVHGFRSTFKDWAAEETSFAGELSEAQLAHTIKNAAQAAYERGDKLEKRRALLVEWSSFCGGYTDAQC